MNTTKKNIEVVGLCNAIVDILIQVSDQDLKNLGIHKGVMHLVDVQRQNEVFHYFRKHERTVELGGSCLNTVRALAGLGLKTAFTGMIGNDDYGSRIRERMQQLSIKDCLGTRVDATGTCIILITPDGERTMNTHLGASRLYDENLIPESAITASKIIHFSGYQWDTDGQKKAIIKAIEIASKNDTIVSFDVSDPFVVDRHKAEFLDIIRDYADIVFANHEEAQILFGGSAEKAANKIAAYDSLAAIKMGSEGALVQKGDHKVQIPVFKVRVVDTTAAGDMFAAGFLFGFLRDKPIEKCGQYASYLAADVISRIGATLSDSALAKTPQL